MIHNTTEHILHEYLARYFGSENVRSTGKHVTTEVYFFTIDRPQFDGDDMRVLRGKYPCKIISIRYKSNGNICIHVVITP